jgi:hypothetical protein
MAKRLSHFFPEAVVDHPCEHPRRVQVLQLTRLWFRSLKPAFVFVC